MALRSHAPAAMLLALLAGCGGGTSPPSSGGSTGGGGSLTGRERIGWIQAAGDADLGLYGFALYVDGDRRVLEPVECRRESATASDCSAPLPTLTPGRHVLEIATFVVGAEPPLESARSTPVEVVIGAALSADAAAIPDEQALESSDGVRLRAQVLARDLDDPVDLTLDPQGRVLVLERAGLLRSFSAAPGREETAGASAVSDARAPDRRVLSLAVAPDFPSSRQLYVLTADPAGGGTRATLTRYREVSGRLGEAAVLRSELLDATELTGVVRLGGDGLLYVAAGTAEGGAYLLRFDRDGRTPRDSPAASPVAAVLTGAPVGLAWAGSGGTRWHLQADARTARLVVTGAGRREEGAITLPLDADASGLTVLPAGDRAPHGALVVAARGAQDLLQYALESTAGLQGATPSTLLHGRFGAVGAVTASADGVLYFTTANVSTWGAGRDVLVRLAIESGGLADAFRTPVATRPHMERPAR